MLNLLTFCAFITACVSHLWDVCLQDGMIFGKLGNKLHYSKAWYAKPLGGCVVCANVWHSVIAFALIDLTSEILRAGIVHAWMMLVAFIALSNMFVRLINRWID
jgi:hypothetical protein